MKKIFASALLFASVSTHAFAGNERPDVLKAGVARVKANIDWVLSQMAADRTALEGDALIQSYLTKSSRAFEQTTENLNAGQAALDAGDFNGFLDNFALGCNRVAAARAQIGNAGRRAKSIASTFPAADFLFQQESDILDTRNEANCPT